MRRSTPRTPPCLSRRHSPPRGRARARGDSAILRRRRRCRTRRSSRRWWRSRTTPRAVTRRSARGQRGSTSLPGGGDGGLNERARGASHRARSKDENGGGLARFARARAPHPRRRRGPARFRSERCRAPATPAPRGARDSTPTSDRSASVRSTSMSRFRGHDTPPNGVQSTSTTGRDLGSRGGHARSGAPRLRRARRRATPSGPSRCRMTSTLTSSEGRLHRLESCASMRACAAR